ncbi:MAG: TonB-dependent receptor plug domain-containing protein [Alphaproteobacteria bacterium]|nr:TonB-dependent receptor plug domain-containing protein [Alphaproteobacteria bacterium]MCB9695573.1 TonB-dependent receptor plug domain-containing protein [Alphaproteobacteria bacterium]
MTRTVPALLLLLAVPSLAEARDVQRFVLAAGNNDGGPTREPLRWAVADAERVATVLADLGGVAASDLEVLREPGPKELLGALERVGQRVASAEAAGLRTEVVVYFSGHSDERGLVLSGQSLTYDELRAGLEAIPSDVRVAVVDACSSGALVREKGGVQRPAFLLDLSNDIEGQAILTSSSAEESSQESDRLEGSFFTHHLVTGLRGAADQSGDGRVTLTEAYRFAYDATLGSTERTTYGPQHPSWSMRLEGAGDLVITDVAAISSSLVLASDLRGRVFLRDGGGHLVAELDKPAGHDVALGVDAGHYTLTVELDDGLYETELDLEPDTSLQVTTSTLVLVVPEAGRPRGDAPPRPFHRERDEQRPPIELDRGDYVITREQIARRGYRSVADVLASVPGVYRAYDRVEERIVSRGRMTDRRAPSRTMQVLIDGRPLPRTALGDWMFGPEMIPITAVERVVFTQGVATSVEAGGATTATIDIVTRPASGPHDDEIRASGGGMGQLGGGGDGTVAASGGGVWSRVAVAGGWASREAAPGTSFDDVPPNDLGRTSTGLAVAGAAIGSGGLRWTALVSDRRAANWYDPVAPFAESWTERGDLATRLDGFGRAGTWDLEAGVGLAGSQLAGVRDLRTPQRLEAGAAWTGSARSTATTEGSAGSLRLGADLAWEHLSAMTFGTSSGTTALDRQRAAVFGDVTRPILGPLAAVGSARAEIASSQAPTLAGRAGFAVTTRRVWWELVGVSGVMANPAVLEVLRSTTPGDITGWGRTEAPSSTFSLGAEMRTRVVPLRGLDLGLSGYGQNVWGQVSFLPQSSDPVVSAAPLAAGGEAWVNARAALSEDTWIGGGVSGGANGTGFGGAYERAVPSLLGAARLDGGLTEDRLVATLEGSYGVLPVEDVRYGEVDLALASRLVHTEGSDLRLVIRGTNLLQLANPVPSYVLAFDPSSSTGATTFAFQSPFGRDPYENILALGRTVTLTVDLTF